MTMASISARHPLPDADQAGNAPGSEFARDVAAGLAASPKRLSPKYLYDEAGIRLFDRITEQPEYYPTRAEMEILRTQASAITALFPPGAALIEFGMGTGAKARILLAAAPSLASYVPVDIAAPSLAAEAAAIAADFPAIAVLPVAADFTQRFELPAAVREQPRVGFFPGSTLGNFEPHEASRFLVRARDILGPGAILIIGIDLVKDPAVLNAAYNDSEGVTAAFNLNLLARINRETGADFDPSRFEHHAFFNRRHNRIEMHLASARRQRVHIGEGNFDFRAGETIHTESSYKYSIESFGALARGAGWRPQASWTDAAGYFSVHALAAAEQPIHAVRG